MPALTSRTGPSFRDLRPAGPAPLPSCGGEAERASGPVAASDAARKAFLGSDAEAYCATLHTERFIRDTYGSIVACKRVVGTRDGPL
jgi:hypothetical protein